jgi:hypothetical protein
MSYSDVINALVVLKAHPDLEEYVCEFDGHGGFMFNRETDPHRVDCAARLETLLDPHGCHTGSSWGSMLRGIQAVLSGILQREKLVNKAAEEEEHINIMRAKNAELRKAQAEAKADIEEKSSCEIINIIKEF